MAVLSIEGAFPNNHEECLQHAKQLIAEKNASVMVFFMTTDYFTIEDKKAGINFLLDAMRVQGIATILILSPMFVVQDLSDLRADRVEFVNFHLWRAYNEIINKKKSKANLIWQHNSDKFLFLTGKPDKPQRVRLLYKFYASGLLDKCCWSFWYNAENIEPLKQLVPEVNESQLLSLLDSWVQNPDNIKMQSMGKSFHYCGIPYDVNLFSSAKFRVISESVFGDNVPLPPFNYWLGEKTYITLFNRVPWIVAGQPGSLQWLRDQGYETFEKHLPQPYDLILNEELRLNAIVENTKSWIAHIPDTETVNQQVEHNFYRAVAQAQQYQTLLDNLIKEFNIAATPELLVPTVDK